MDSITYVLGKGAPGLLNLRVSAYRVHVVVNGPGMLYGRMRLLTSLGLHDGCTFARPSALASALRIVALCGNAGPAEVPVEIVSSRVGARVEFGLGPAGMYQSELVLSTAEGRPFDEMLRRVFGPRADGALFGLEPLPGEGHHGGSAHGEPRPAVAGHGGHPGHSGDAVDPSNPPGAHDDHHGPSRA
jgi:hypothetical protein